MSESGTMRALHAEVSEHARIVREGVETAAREALGALVAEVLAEYATKLRADLPPTYVAQCADAVAHRFSLRDVHGARDAILRGLWAALGAALRHRSGAHVAPTLPYGARK